jgi:hypothetical protein
MDLCQYLSGFVSVFGIDTIYGFEPKFSEQMSVASLKNKLSIN